MAAIKADKNKALAALTTAALCLPGLDISAAVPAAQITGNASYGRYQESDNRMKVDIYHIDATIPLSDRVELAFSLDRDIYSGATPAFSIPESLTNLPKYKQKSDGTSANELSYVDLISAASGGVTASGLTVLGGLNGFQEFNDNYKAADATITSNLNNTLSALVQTKDITKNTLKTSFNADEDSLEQDYVGILASLNPAITPEFDEYKNAKSIIRANIETLPVSIIKNEFTVDFGGTGNIIMGLASYAGFANNTPIAGGNCAGAGAQGCIYQNNMVFGIIEDSSNSTAHLHRAGNAANRALSYHADSPGIYMRALDSSAFGLISMDFLAPINDKNPDNGVNDFWEILGFNTALNPGLDKGDGTNYATRVAYQKIANGFNGELILDATFHNINAVWIHFNGYPKTPDDGKEFELTIDNIKIAPPTNNTAALYEKQLADLKANFYSQLGTLSSNNPVEFANLTQLFNQELAVITGEYQAALSTAEQLYSQNSEQQKAAADALNAQAAIDFYRLVLNKMVPTGTPAVQRFQIQPQEARSMPQLTAKYYFDATTLALSGGLSDEPDFLSHFGSINVSHEFNDKLTTISGGYGMTSNSITRNGGHTDSHHGDDPTHNPTDYTDLNDDSDFHSFNASIAQVLSKNTLFQSTANFSHQRGYLSNPYKYVYVRGEITPEEYYQLWHAEPGEADWKSVTDLEVVGLELFRDKRPDQRNIWSFSNRINHYMPQMDATAHLDYRFFIDDWGVNSHTFELKWYQSLPGGLTVTPGIRYYSQSQADFFAPYFLSPRADGNYSSDFRLSAFGDLSGGLTVSKQFARGIKVEAGFEYVTHSGSLKLGGGGVGDYADFDYFLAHANLSVDLSARQMGAGDDHSGHHMHHHGAPVPAGIMFGHMMNKADDIMVGYRFMYSMQDGSMLHGSNKVNDQLLISNACKGLSNGCLYKPAEMNMQMHMLDLMYAPTDWLNLMVMPQIMSMDMTMSESLQAGGDDSHGGTEHTSSDIGDTVITALVKVADTGNHKVHLGIGMSAPTGSINAKLSSGTLQNSGSSTQVEPGTAVLQDYGMQLGSGTWDLKPSLTYTGQADEWGWGAQLSGVKRLEKNDHGYAYGDIFQATGWGSYTIFNWLSASVRGIYTWQDEIRGETNQPHDTTATVDYPANYGGKTWDIGLGLNAFIPAGQFAGHSVSVEWLQPVSTDANGFQLDRQGAISASWSFMF
ncbi:DUF3570 domain-containing protein [Methylicorpusculum sp.]|uniref:DUF3570 domain-containing protein n=1 Tax=Methylicorpusculum sp. TaxID=2713644 RepID=UPI002723A5BD|nr:DUF3570 domain-containing protein [Methylicorpusculum sp.]MDO8844312.1 DUF3570 domain-containing protein [Methylicorpusculum sp.]